MEISSRTPEGQANHCHVCGSEVKIEPSDPAGDAPCPRCGHLLWFTWEDLGDVDVIRPTKDLLTRDIAGYFPGLGRDETGKSPYPRSHRRTLLLPVPLWVG